MVHPNNRTNHFGVRQNLQACWTQYFAKQSRWFLLDFFINPRFLHEKIHDIRMISDYLTKQINMFYAWAIPCIPLPSRSCSTNGSCEGSGVDSCDESCQKLGRPFSVEGRWFELGFFWKSQGNSFFRRCRALRDLLVGILPEGWDAADGCCEWSVRDGLEALRK